MCAHWLGGFNDGNKEPQFPCAWLDCPKSYLPDGLGQDFDRSKDINGPFGTGNKTDVCI